MKILPDHNLDPRFYSDLSDKLCAPVYSAKFLDIHHLENGEMLFIAQIHGITHTLTFDKTMQHQTDSPIAILAINQMPLADLCYNRSLIAAHLRAHTPG